MEHLYLPDLPVGIYRVEVSTNLAVECALAWRLDLEHQPRIAGLDFASGLVDFTLDDCVSSARYALSVSETLGENSWSVERYFTLSGNSGVLENVAGGSKRFYRLDFLKP